MSNTFWTTPLQCIDATIQFPREDISLSCSYIFQLSWLALLAISTVLITINTELGTWNNNKETLNRLFHGTFKYLQGRVMFLCQSMRPLALQILIITNDDRLRIQHFAYEHIGLIMNFRQSFNNPGNRIK